MTILAVGLIVALLVGLGLRTMHRRCVLCQCKGIDRTYYGANLGRSMIVTLCDRCDCEFGLAMATPMEIADDVSRAVNALTGGA